MSSEKKIKIYTKQWDRRYSYGVERIVVDDIESPMTLFISDLIADTIGKINNSYSIANATKLSRDFSNNAFTLFPFLGLESAENFHKLPKLDRYVLGIKYISKFEEGAIKLSDLTNSEELACSGQSFLTLFHLDSAWKAYNLKPTPKFVDSHVFIARPLHDRYILSDTSLAKKKGTVFSMPKKEFESKYESANVLEISIN